MKKIIVSIFLSIFFVSCLDYTQYVSIDDDKNITVVAIATISKSLIEFSCTF